MPSPIVSHGATVTCAHAGQATPVTSFARVTVGGLPVITLTTGYVVVGCALAGGPVPPCVAGHWLSGATRVLVGGTPVAVQSGFSTSTPTGAPMQALEVQTRALAS